MRIHEPSRHERLSDDPKVRLASRIAAVLLSCGFSLSTWWGIEGLRDAYLAGHPSLLKPAATTIVTFTAAVYFAWAAYTNFPWVTDGDDLGED